MENAQSWVGSLAYSPVLSLIATGSRSGRVALWDFCTLQQMQNLQCRGAVASVLFLDPRPLLLTGDAHGSIIMWVVSSKKQVSTLCIIEGAGSGITSLTRFDSTHHMRMWHGRRAHSHVGRFIHREHRTTHVNGTTGSGRHI